jgi:hypothetical protein
VCGADIAEEGAMGCCDAWTATCAGSLDGKPFSWDDFDENDPTFDEDAIDARVVYHNWYPDTGEEAPDELGRTSVRCRCERTGA